MRCLLMLLVGAALVLIPPAALSQQTLDDVVYLKNGSIIRGIIIEQIPNQTLKIQTKDGNVFVYNIDEAERITKEPPLGTKPTWPQGMRRTGYKSPGVAFVLSFLIPGAGQVYNGQTGKGVLQFLAVATGYTLFIVERPRTEEVWVYGYYEYYYGHWETQDKGNGAIAWPSLALAAGFSLWSMIDAPTTASRLNRDMGHSLNEIELKKNVKLAFSPIDFEKGTITPNAKMIWRF